MGAIARALAMNPRVLAYDEPTSALDPRVTPTSREVDSFIKRRRPVTQIIVTHDLVFAENVGGSIDQSYAK